jgi:hypothetical protein
MTLNLLVERLRNHGLRAGANMVAVSIALLVIGYGMVKTPELSMLQSREANAAVPAGPMPNSLAQPDSPVPAPASREQRAAAAGDAGDRSEAPRECVPERGVTEACTYN